MLRAENEGLAERLVDLCLQDAPRDMDFLTMVMYRSCTTDPEQGMNGALQLGIDGPYLKTAALAVIAAFEHPPKDANHHRVFRSTYAVAIAIAYLRFHPEDKEAFDRLVGIAKRCAALPATPCDSRKPSNGQQPAEQAEQPAMRSNVAWQILLELGVLHADMDVGEAIEILGRPSSRSDKSLIWYLGTPRHVNPGLSATVEGDRITSFHRYAG